MGPTLRSMFEQTVAKYPDKEGLVDIRAGRRWTYQEWDEEVNCLANTLKDAGVEKGDKVSTVLFNTAEFATTLFACMKIGAVFNPINFRLTGKEITFFRMRHRKLLSLRTRHTSRWPRQREMYAVYSFGQSISMNWTLPLTSTIKWKEHRETGLSASLKRMISMPLCTHQGRLALQKGCCIRTVI